MNDFYNQSTKERYLRESNLSDDSRDVIASLFERTKTTEEFYGQDLYAFTLEQIDKVMKLMSSATYNSALNNKSRINRYISWAIENGLRHSNINPLQIATEDWLNQYVDSVSKRFLSETEISDIIEELGNYQDKALILAIFEGISGNQYSELLSMSVKNINDENNTIKVTNSKRDKSRLVKISNKLKSLLYAAYNEVDYMYPNGETIVELVNNEDKILKATLWKNTQANDLKYHGILRRITSIRERFDLEEFSVKTILDSGKIKMGCDLIKRNKKQLSSEEYALIGDRFDVNKISNAGYLYHNTSVIKRIVSRDNILELYGIDENDYKR